MRKFYLVSSITVGVLILVMSFAQLGGDCSLYLFPSSLPVFLIFLQVACIGAIFGGLLVFYWKTPKEDIEDSSEDIPPTSSTPPTKIE